MLLCFYISLATLSKNLPNHFSPGGASFDTTPTLQCSLSALQFFFLTLWLIKNLFCTLPVGVSWLLLIEDVFCPVPVAAEVAKGVIGVRLVLHMEKSANVGVLDQLSPCIASLYLKVHLHEIFYFCFFSSKAPTQSSDYTLNSFRI